MTVGELNDFLLDVLEIEAEKRITLDFRVDRDGEKSNIISVIFVPFTVEYTEMYVVGSFTDWNPANALAMTNTGFNTFEILVDVPDGGQFKFIPTNTSWEGNWGVDSNNEGMLINDGANISGLSKGKYKVSIDLTTFTYVIEEILVTPPDNLYLVGSSVAAGWDPSNNNHPMFKDPTEEGIFVYTGYFMAGDVKLLEKGDWQPQWGKGAADGELAGNPDTFLGTTRLWNETWYDSTLPHWLLDRSFISIDALSTQTAHWFDNGRFWGWEGVDC